MERNPDIMDVWIDAGTASWSALTSPEKGLFDALYPADFILEGKDQIRGWLQSALRREHACYGEYEFQEMLHAWLHQ
jgi:isoleucyl-tRNA synthetase